MNKVIKTIEITFGVIILIVVFLGWFGNTKFVKDFAQLSPDEASELGQKHGEAIAEKVKGTSKTDTNNSLSKEKLDFYKDTFTNLVAIQDQYEEEYAKSGKDGLYGNINRRLIAIRDNLPKTDSEMPENERELLTNLRQYTMDLYFLNPRDNELEGLGVASDRRELIEAALENFEVTK